MASLNRRGSTRTGNLAQAQPLHAGSVLRTVNQLQRVTSARDVHQLEHALHHHLSDNRPVAKIENS